MRKDIHEQFALTPGAQVVRSGELELWCNLLTKPAGNERKQLIAQSTQDTSQPIAHSSDFRLWSRR
jgi:hypothetical protein